jgi:hypothetical protein
MQKKLLKALIKKERLWGPLHAAINIMAGNRFCKLRVMDELCKFAGCTLQAMSYEL